jgi:hypothetical protein
LAPGRMRCENELEVGEKISGARSKLTPSSDKLNPALYIETEACLQICCGWMSDLGVSQPLWAIEECWRTGARKFRDRLLVMLSHQGLMMTAEVVSTVNICFGCKLASSNSFTVL